MLQGTRLISRAKKHLHSAVVGPRLTGLSATVLIKAVASSLQNVPPRNPPESGESKAEQ